MKILIRSVFTKKDEPIAQFNDFINFFYWFLLMAINVYKWVYAFLFIEAIYKWMFIAIISTPTLIKLLFIGIPNFMGFKKYIHNAVKVFFSFISK